jgi:hypothetical protein
MGVLFENGRVKQLEAVGFFWQMPTKTARCGHLPHIRPVCSSRFRSHNALPFQELILPTDFKSHRPLKQLPAVYILSSLTQITVVRRSCNFNKVLTTPQLQPRNLDLPWPGADN